MASTIITKYGSGAPTASDLVQGELAVDLTNKRLYTEDSGGNVIEVGTNPSSLTIGGTALTATAAELNTLDGITATTAELNTLDGITATVTELNYTDGVTSNIQTQLNTKAPIASPTFTGTVTAPAVNVNGTVTADGVTVEDGDARISNSGDVRLILSNTSNANPSSAAGIELLEGPATGNFGTASNFGFKIALDGSDNTLDIFSGVQTDVKKRMQISRDNGDISFYEDTGTTAKFFWDASAESLGIGETVLDEALVVRGGAYSANQNGGIALQLGSASGSHFKGAFKLKTDGSGVCRTVIESTAGTSGGTIEAISIPNGSGNVGIGTTTPTAGRLQVKGEKTSQGIHFLAEDNSSGNTGGFWCGNSGTTFEADPANAIASSYMGFNVDGSEAMRIDSSGNLLVGKTSSGIASTGFETSSSGLTQITNNSASPLQLNRLTSDGNILNFFKDGTTVGSIGSSPTTSQTYFAGTSRGVTFGSSTLYPCSNTGSGQDAQLDIGSGTYRFKDLYLSGGVVFGSAGGAVTSKTLDDYEEGNWTPVPQGGTTTGSYTDSLRVGRYTKIGNRVLFDCTIYVTDFTGTGDFQVSGLPFTIATNNATVEATVQANNAPWTLGADEQHVVAHGVAGQSYMEFRTTNRTGTTHFTKPQCAHSLIGYLRITGQYYAA